MAALARKTELPGAPAPAAGSGSPSREGDSVRVSIEYCERGNYGPTAEGLRQALVESFGVDVELTPSVGGVFEVQVCGRLIFSKRANHRLPARDEIFYHVRTALNGR